MANTKKGVSKEELRRLMKQNKTESTIIHPLAKYNSIGNLMCIACSCQVKSDRLWNPHILGRSHKEKVAALQYKSQQLSQSLVTKRVQSDASDSPAKKLKEESPAAPHGKPAAPIKGILKNSALTLAQYSDSESEGDEATNKSDEGPEAPGVSGLPTDFFDSTIAAGSETDADTPDGAEGPPTEALPEGFFDDPKADAKARNVEYVDKNEEEWAAFQREMKEETGVSERLEQEDDTAITEERHIEEIDEQMAQWSRVQNIVDKKEELMKSKTNRKKEVYDSDSDDITDLEEFLDWRTKAIIN